ncbi:hypothetical protein ABSA28_00620 [Candidatus Hepatincolaceae symbiont of Richtersius coronifer]
MKTNIINTLIGSITLGKGTNHESTSCITHSKIKSSRGCRLIPACQALYRIARQGPEILLNIPSEAIVFRAPGFNKPYGNFNSYNHLLGNLVKNNNTTLISLFAKVNEVI